MSLPRSPIIVAMLAVLALSACGVNSARQNALELTAVEDIRSILNAQVQYSSQFGRFAANLSELGASNLIPASLSSGEKGGYKFTMAAVPNGFTINASPKTYNETGQRSFYSDQTMVIRANQANEPASASSPEFGK